MTKPHSFTDRERAKHLRLTGRGSRAYYHTFLTRPHFYTRDIRTVQESRFIYDACDWPGAEGWYSSSWLGVINGLLPFRLRLFGCITEPVSDGTRYVLGYSIGRLPAPSAD